MLCGLIGLMGLVPTGLDGAYEKYFVRGDKAFFCNGKAEMNKNCKVTLDKKPRCLQCLRLAHKQQQNFGMCVLCLYFTFDSLRTTGLALPVPFRADRGSRMLKGTNPI